MSNKIDSVLYIRSATNSKHALELQRSNGTTYAEENNITLSVIEETQSSGVTPINDRPCMRWLIHLVEVGLVKNVIVSNLTRISRRATEVHQIQSIFAKHCAKLIVIDQNELTST